MIAVPAEIKAESPVTDHQVGSELIAIAAV
jgi:hypothetical protein